MASNSESPTRSRRKQKQKRNEMMEVETNPKEDALNRSIEDIRSKMKEIRRKKAQADRSLSRSRHKNATLILKATLRQNNRSLAKSLEAAKSECRQAQNDLVEMQRERHVLESIVNRFKGQHIKQRNQIKGVHETLRKVTSSLMDTVGLLAEAMEQCVIPRHTKDRSLGLVFRTSCSLTSDDLSDPETRACSSSANTSSMNLSGAPQRVPTNREVLRQQTAENVTGEEEEVLPDIDIPLLFSSDPTAPQEKEKSRRDTRNVSAGNRKLSRRTSSLLDPATIAAVAAEIGRSAEDIKTVVEETANDCESDERLSMISIDERGQNEGVDEERKVRKSHGRRVSKKLSGRRLSKNETNDADAYDHRLSEVENSAEAENERLAPICIDEERGEHEEIDERRKVRKSHERRVSVKRSGRPSSRNETKDVDAYDHSLSEGEKTGEGEDERLAPICIDEKRGEHEEIDEGRKVRKSHERQVSMKRSGKTSSRKEAGHVVSSDLRLSEGLVMGDAIRESEDNTLPVDESNQASRGTRRSGRLSKKKISYVYPNDDIEDEMEEEDVEMEIGEEDGEIVRRSSGAKGSKKRSRSLSRRRGTFLKEDAVIDGLQEIEILDDEDEATVDAIMAAPEEEEEEPAKDIHHRHDTHETNAGEVRIEEKLDAKASKKHKKKKTDTKVRARAKSSKHDEKQDASCENDNSAEKSDYRIMDMELTSAANGHISIVRDLQTKEKEDSEDGGSEMHQESRPDVHSRDNSPRQDPEEFIARCKEKPKSRLPVLSKGKSTTSKSKKSSHKGLSRIGATKESKKRCDEKDVQNMTVFDLSVGDSFSLPTPPCLKSKSLVKPNPDKDAGEHGKMLPITSSNGAGDGFGESKESIHDADEDDFANPDTNTLRKNKEAAGKARNSKIKRKSRKAKTIVTPEALEPKVRLKKMALLEEFNNLDASYLTDVTNQERNTLIAASLPSRKSNQKDDGESLSDLMVRPHLRKSSKRKLSKRSFYFGDSGNEEDQRRSTSGRTSEARTSEGNTHTLETSLLLLDKPNPDSTFSLPKPSSATLDTSINILDLENILLEADLPKVTKKKIQRRTTILKQHGQASKRAANMNVTFCKDDLGYSEAEEDKVTNATCNPEGEVTKFTKEKSAKPATRKTFNVDDIAKTFFGSSEDFDEGEDDEDSENIITDTQTVAKPTSKLQPSPGSPVSRAESRAESRTTSRTEGIEILEDIKIGDSPDRLTVEPIQPSKGDDASQIANEDDIGVLDSYAHRSPMKETKEAKAREVKIGPVQPSKGDQLLGVDVDDIEDDVLVQDRVPSRSSQPDRSHIKEVKELKAQKVQRHKEKINDEITVLDDDDEDDLEQGEHTKVVKIQKTNKREFIPDHDDDPLEGNPRKVAKTSVSVPEEPERRGRRAKAVSYKEPSLHSKLRQGDPNTFSVYKDGLTALKGQKKKRKFRVPLSTVN